MRVLILHHHLDPGGVTRVIASQIKASRLVGMEDILVLVGRAPEKSPDSFAKIKVLKCLDYLEESENDNAESKLKRALFETETALSRVFRENDIIHAHNVNLGKNPILTAALASFSARGARIFRHCHDFAEDRPLNMAFLKKVFSGLSLTSIEAALYPRGRGCFYGALNSLDRARLAGFGIEKRKIRWLPNPVDIEQDIEKIRPEDARRALVAIFGLNPNKKIFVYPVRAITRKNVGELLFLAALFKDRSEWLITQPPRNPCEVPLFEEWKRFAQEKRLPVHFDAGEKLDFVKLARGADACVTTSVMEGFGMAFLEPWLYGKAILGRNLRNATIDFLKEGLTFPLLYDRILIRDKNGAPPRDFPELGTARQKEIIVQVLENADIAAETLARNAFLSGFFLDIPVRTVNENARIIKRRHSLKAYGRKLLGIYRKMAENA